MRSRSAYAGLCAVAVAYAGCGSLLDSDRVRFAAPDASAISPGVDKGPLRGDEVMMPPAADAAVPEQHPMDAALPDAAFDSGMPDAGSLGAPDTGAPDTAVPDAGVPHTALPDAGVPHTALPDAGVPDAGVPDDGVRPDPSPGPLRPLGAAEVMNVLEPFAASSLTTTSTP